MTKQMNAAPSQAPLEPVAQYSIPVPPSVTEVRRVRVVEGEHGPEITDITQEHLDAKRAAAEAEEQAEAAEAARQQSIVDQVAKTAVKSEGRLVAASEWSPQEPKGAEVQDAQEPSTQELKDAARNVFDNFLASNPDDNAGAAPASTVEPNATPTPDNDANTQQLSPAEQQEANLETAYKIIEKNSEFDKPNGKTHAASRENLLARNKQALTGTLVEMKKVRDKLIELESNPFYGPAPTKKAQKQLRKAQKQFDADQPQRQKEIDALNDEYQYLHRVVAHRVASHDKLRTEPAKKSKLDKAVDKEVTRLDANTAAINASADGSAKYTPRTYKYRSDAKNFDTSSETRVLGGRDTEFTPYASMSKKALKKMYTRNAKGLEAYNDAEYEAIEQRLQAREDRASKRGISGLKDLGVKGSWERMQNEPVLVPRNASPRRHWSEEGKKFPRIRRPDVRGKVMDARLRTSEFTSKRPDVVIKERINDRLDARDKRIDDTKKLEAAQLKERMNKAKASIIEKRKAAGKPELSKAELKEKAKKLISKESAAQLPKNKRARVAAGSLVKRGIKQVANRAPKLRS